MRIKVSVFIAVCIIMIIIGGITVYFFLNVAPATSVSYHIEEIGQIQDTNDANATIPLNVKEEVHEEESASKIIEHEIVTDIDVDNGDEIRDTDLEVHFIDVGQGDSILVKCDGEAMLIDAGNNDKGSTVWFYLKKHDVEALKYVIGTHPDADHIGGLDVIVYKFDCDTIMMPGVFSDTQSYLDVLDTIDYKNYKLTWPQVGNEYTLGGASFTILGPSKEYEDNNNNSIAIKLVHGDSVFLFMGDAEEEAERDYISSGMDLKADVLKVGHHGSRTSTSEGLLSAVNPDFAIISCGKDNAYGHPHDETMDKLHSEGCLIYRTDMQGSIIAYSDGHSLTWSCTPVEILQEDESQGENLANEN